MKVIFCSDFTPVPGVQEKLNLDGRLAMSLMEAFNSEVDWIRTNFSHYEKSYNSVKSQAKKCNILNINITEFNGLGYAKNISFRRILHNIDYAIKSFFYVIRSEGVDVVITPIPSLELSFLVSIACKFKRLKHIVLVYDKWPDIFFEYDKSRKRVLGRLLYQFYMPLLRFSIANARHVFCVSQSYKDWLSNKVLVNSSSVLYIGVNENQDIIEDRATIGSITVVYVGSWGESYDIDMIIQAARELEDTRFEFIVAGRTPSDRAYKETRNLKIMGWINDDEKHQLMKKADVALMPYKANALQSVPNKIFEYMEYGCFIVNTLNGESKEIIDENSAGITVQAGSVGAFSAGILSYLYKAHDRQALKKKIQDKYGVRYYEDAARMVISC